MPEKFTNVLEKLIEERIAVGEPAEDIVEALTHHANVVMGQHNLELYLVVTPRRKEVAA